MNTLQLVICESPEDAIARGHVYRAPTQGLTLKSAVLVKKGTKEGNPTVDLVLKGDDGKEYVAMTTGALLKPLLGLL